MSQVYTNNPNTLNTTGNTLNNGTVINTMYRDSTYHPQPQTSISFNNSTTPAVPLGGTQLSGSQLKGSNVRMSRIKEGTHYQNTNNLYRPLKETFEHPEILRQHEGLTPVVAQSSYVSKEYRKLNTLELRNMVNHVLLRKTIPLSLMPSLCQQTILKRLEVKSLWLSMLARKLLGLLFLRKKWKRLEGRE